MPYKLLSEPIRRYIRDEGWQQLRAIQAAAITRITASDDNFVLASRTASGKTEAAFLPILSKVDFGRRGVRVLYISPLVALINDQFERVEKLCEYLDVKVTKWHGEAKRAQKERLVKQPEGVVLITPESIEAMFVNRPYYVRELFAELEYVVVDEVHAFVGAERGIHLSSLLHRLRGVNRAGRFSVVALSATIGDYSAVKRFTGEEDRTRVLLDKRSKEIVARFRYFRGEQSAFPLEMIKDLYLETSQNKVLIFPNSRGKCEEVAVKLRRIAERVGGHPYHFSHHSSVDREVREYVEHFASNSRQTPFTISCTSTLELGIDIGAVDLVVQIDSTYSVASLIQRVGRSGRGDDRVARLTLYATNPWSLIQAVACWELHSEGSIEPPEVAERPYDILLHQILSMVKSSSGVARRVVVNELAANPICRKITREQVEEIIDHMVAQGMLEQLREELIIGVDGEWMVGNRDFYSVFTAEKNYRVICSGNKIGEVAYTPQIVEDENIFLAAKVWRIKVIDHKTKRIEVVAAPDGKRPIYLGEGVAIPHIIRRKMQQVMAESRLYDYLDEASQDELRKVRRFFASFPLLEQCDVAIQATSTGCELYTFAGTKINRALRIIFKLNGIDSTVNELSSQFSVDVEAEELAMRMCQIEASDRNIDHYLEELIEENPQIMNFSKWGGELPSSYQCDLLRQSYYDFEGAREFLRQAKPRVNRFEITEY